jgi:hypothetical protein
MMGIRKVLANNLYMLNHATGCNANYTFMSSTHFRYTSCIYKNSIELKELEDHGTWRVQC